MDADEKNAMVPSPLSALWLSPDEKKKFFRGAAFAKPICVSTQNYKVQHENISHGIKATTKQLYFWQVW